MRKAVVSLLCITIMLFGGVFVSADDSISISQTVNFSGTTTTSQDFTYTLTPEESNIDGIETGIEGGCILQTGTLNFLLSEGENQTKSISIDCDTTAFDHAGIYRYRLTNLTQNEYGLLEITILSENGQLKFTNYAFYSADGTTKINGFTYTTTDTPTPPSLVTSNIIFRFVDEQGNSLADDICFVEEHEQMLAPPIMATDNGDVEEKTVSVVKGASRYGNLVAFAPVWATGYTDAYSMYEVVLAGLLNDGYTVITDEIATHGNTGNWAKSNEDTVYTVTMASPQSPDTFRVKIAKMSAGEVVYYLANAEFTLFDGDGNIVTDIYGNPCVGTTDENGNLEFRIYNNGGTYYIMETKAPTGYEINPDKFYITPENEGVTDEGDNVLLVPITVRDNPIVIIPNLPKTGDTINLIILVGTMLVGTAGLTTIIIIKNKKRGKVE